MRKLALFLALVSAVGLPACGGSSSSAPAEGSEGSMICDDVPLGTFAGQTWSASNIEGMDVPCETAQAVAKQWAAQQVGGPQAKLPAGWICDGNSVCRKGGSRVTFSLKLEE